MSAEDMAKIGLLCLNNGSFKATIFDRVDFIQEYIVPYIAK